MDVSDDFVYLSNWVIKFLEGEHNDFDIILEGIVGRNSLSLTENEYYRTDSIIGVLKYNQILCDGSVKVMLESRINEQDMLEMGFTKECVSCFRYGFPTNWIELLEYVFDKIMEQSDLLLPNELFEVALKDMDEYKNINYDNAVSLINWDISLSLHGDDDFNIILNGTISDNNSFANNPKKITELILDREKINLVSCTNKQLYKLESMINFSQMREHGYTIEFIECFKYGFPNNWILLFDELYNQYRNSVNNFIFSRNLINEAIIEMEDFEQANSISQPSQEKQNVFLENEEIKHLHILGSENNSESILPSPQTFISSHCSDKNESILLSNVHLPEDEQNSTHLALQTPGVPLIMSTPVVNKSQQVLGDGSYSNFSPILVPSPIEVLKNKVKLELVMTPTLSINESNGDKKHQITDFFAISNDCGSLSEVRKRKVDKQGKRKILSSPENTPVKHNEIKKRPKKKVLKKKHSATKKISSKLTNFENLANNINNDHSIQDLFDATLGLGDLENTKRGKFDFTDDSIVGRQILEDTIKEVGNENKNLVYYLPANNHIYKKNPKPKKVEKKPTEDIPFDFEKLVYEEIEKNKASESYTLEERLSM
uniref:SANTA domain-containing protein n=1 Tax=Strongyloides venezuelensis TaxID=75913 RepID=A0A0K0FYW9_STRVS